MAGLIRNIAVLALMALFLVPLLGYALGTNTTTTENRALSAWPSWNGNLRDYTGGIDEHLADRFGARMTLIRLAREVKDNLGEDAPQAVRGQGPWLFLGEAAYRDEFEGVGAWDDSQVTDWIEVLDDAHALFAERGIPMAVSIAPDKARIYPERVPADWRMGSRRFKDRILQAPELAAFAFDSEPGILARKAAGEDVYYARDTHWNASGGFEAALRILAMLDPDGTLTRYRPDPPATYPADRLYDLEAMLGETETSEPDAYSIRKPIRSGYTVTNPHLQADGTPRRGAFATIVNTDANDDGAKGTLVIVGDSFADTMLLHLMPSYDRIVRIHHGGRFFTVGTDEILAYEPDAVLVMIVERSAQRKARPIVVGPTIDGEGNPIPLETPFQ